MSQPLALTLSRGSPSPQQNSDHRVDKTESKKTELVLDTEKSRESLQKVLERAKVNPKAAASVIQGGGSSSVKVPTASYKRSLQGDRPDKSVVMVPTLTQSQYLRGRSGVQGQPELHLKKQKRR